MPIEIKITCDSCDKDITQTDAMPRYRLKLSSERLPHSCGMVYAVHVAPAIDKEVYFCNISCLRKYVDIKFSLKNQINNN